jgi:hypothetical protein
MALIGLIMTGEDDWTAETTRVGDCIAGALSDVVLRIDCFDMRPAKAPRERPRDTLPDR